MVALICGGEMIFGFPCDLPRCYRPPVVEVLGLSDADLGEAFTSCSIRQWIDGMTNQRHDLVFNSRGRSAPAASLAIRSSPAPTSSSQPNLCTGQPLPRTGCVNAVRSRSWLWKWYNNCGQASPGGPRSLSEQHVPRRAT